MKDSLKKLFAAVLTACLVAACSGSANPGARNAPTQMGSETDTTSTPYMDTTASDTAK